MLTAKTVLGPHGISLTIVLGSKEVLTTIQGIDHMEYNVMTAGTYCCMTMFSVDRMKHVGPHGIKVLTASKELTASHGKVVDRMELSGPQESLASNNQLTAKYGFDNKVLWTAWNLILTSWTLLTAMYCFNKQSIFWTTKQGLDRMKLSIDRMRFTLTAKEMFGPQGNGGPQLSVLTAWNDIDHKKLMQNSALTASHLFDHKKLFGPQINCFDRDIEFWPKIILVHKIQYSSVLEDFDVGIMDHKVNLSANRRPWQTASHSRPHSLPDRTSSNGRLRI